MRETVTFNIQNTTNGTIPVSIFGNNADLMDNANASTQYLYNLTGFTITNENTVQIDYQFVGTTGFTTASTSFSGTTLQDVVNALNTLNLGSFFITTSGGNTYLNNYNNNIIFNNLGIYSSDVYLNYSFNFISAVAYRIRDSLILIPPYLVDGNGPIVTSGSATPIYNGESITYRVGADALPVTSLITKTNNLTGVVTTLFTINTIAFGTNSVVFTIDNGFTYNISAND
jgi:hypothetical protein